MKTVRHIPTPYIAWCLAKPIFFKT